MEAFIHFLIKYNEKIIYISAGLICLMSAVVVWWQVFGKHRLKTGDQPQIDLSAIEESLKKILIQTNTAMQNVATAASVASGTTKVEGVTTLEGKPLADFEGVKTELQTRAKMIEELQVQVKSAKGDGSMELLAKIKELESKLAEYEIIEDDIADLSFFKEENAKLKKELDRIRRADPKMVDQFAEVLDSEAKEPNDKEADAAITDLAMALNEEAGKVAPATTTINTEPSKLEDVGSINVAAAANAAQKALESDLGQLIVSPPIAATGASTPADTTNTKGDIFDEFKEKESTGADPLAELGEIDPDRMLDELKDLNAELNIGAETLEEEADIDRMAEEATGLTKKS